MKPKIGESWIIVKEREVNVQIYVATALLCLHVSTQPECVASVDEQMHGKKPKSETQPDY